MEKPLRAPSGDDEGREMRGAARGRRTSVAAKLRAIGKATRHEFPTADIDDMLEEIAAGERIE